MSIKSFFTCTSKLFAICTAILLVTPALAHAQAQAIDQKDASEEERILGLWHLRLKPATATRPALKYQLRVPYNMMQPGDATAHYYRALLMESEQTSELKKEYSDNWNKWLIQDSAGSLDEMKAWIAHYGNIVKELKIAAYRERHTVDLRLRDLEGYEAIQFLLPDAQRSRELARALQVKARIEIIEGRFDDAIETLRIGYRLADAVAETPTLINDLVGIAIGEVMTHELLRLVSMPDAPNMYWAVATLPNPLIDMRTGMDWESGVPWQIFPFLRDPETTERTADQWRRLVMDAYLNAHELSGNYTNKPAPLNELAATAMMMKSYPIAKKALIEGGMDQTKVESMPVGQVVAIHTERSLRYVYDETFKWMYLPTGESFQRWIAAENKLRKDGYFGSGGMFRGTLPIADVLLPALPQAWYASVRLQRQLAAIRIVEAIRMHAASHDGELPASLAEIDEVPIPNDPLLDKSFQYRVEGDKAILEMLPRSESQRSADVIRYVIQVAE